MIKMDRHYISKTLFALLALSALQIIECNLTLVIPRATNSVASVVGSDGFNTGETQLPVTRSNNLNILNVASKLKDASSNVLKSNFKLPQLMAPFNEIGYEFEPTRKNENLWEKITGAFKDTVAPIKSYASLINRYHQWFGKYDALRKTAGEDFMPLSSMEMFQQEYAKADEYLMAERCFIKPVAVVEKDEDEGAIDKAEKVENMDFIFKALEYVIEKLENRFRDIETKCNVDISQIKIENDLEEEVNEDRVKAAMERVKRTFLNQAKNIATGELLSVAQQAALGSAAMFVVQHVDGADNMQLLAPLVQMAIARASAPLAVSYLRSLEYRAIVAVLNSVNPIPAFIERCDWRIKSKLKAEEEERKKSA